LVTGDNSVKCPINNLLRFHEATRNNYKIQRLVMIRSAMVIAGTGIPVTTKIIVTMEEWEESTGYI